jgi:hypothetical protein
LWGVIRKAVGEKRNLELKRYKDRKSPLAPDKKEAAFY